MDILCFIVIYQFIKNQINQNIISQNFFFQVWIEENIKLQPIWKDYFLLNEWKNLEIWKEFNIFSSFITTCTKVRLILHNQENCLYGTSIKFNEAALGASMIHIDRGWEFIKAHLLRMPGIMYINTFMTKVGDADWLKLLRRRLVCLLAPTSGGRLDVLRLLSWDQATVYCRRSGVATFTAAWVAQRGLVWIAHGSLEEGDVCGEIL